MFDIFNKWKSRIRVTLRATAVALVAVGCLYVAQNIGFSVTTASKAERLDKLIEFVSIFHSLMAALLLNEVYRRYHDSKACLVTSDTKPLEIYRVAKIPEVMKHILAVFSILIVALVIRASNESFLESAGQVFVYTFILSTYWIVLTEMENPATGLWSDEDFVPADQNI